MSSAVKLILGVSICAMATGFAACDSGGSENNGAAGGPVVPPGTAGAGNSPGGGGAPPAGAGASSTAGAAGTGVAPEGVPIVPMDGWVDAASNSLGIVGAFYAYADDTSKMSQVGTFVGATGCMSGTAAQVIDPCTIAPTANDCFGTYWGAAMGLNLNQPKDPATMMGVKDPLPFDASALKGFYFELSGDMIPASKSLRFKVENATGEFCTPPTKKVTFGPNQFEFKDLIAECWHTTDPANATAETAQSALIKISWAVVTSKDAAVPYNFCVSNIRALLKAGGSGTPLPGSGGAAAGGAAAGGAAAGGAAAGGAAAGGAAAGGASAAGAGGAKGGSGGSGG